MVARRRPLTLGQVASAAGQEVQAAVEALEDLVGRQEPHPGGGELDGQRHALQRGDDAVDRLGVVLVDREPVPDGSCLLGEQLDAVGDWQGRHGELSLGPEP